MLLGYRCLRPAVVLPGHRSLVAFAVTVLAFNGTFVLFESIFFSDHMLLGVRLR